MRNNNNLNPINMDLEQYYSDSDSFILNNKDKEDIINELLYNNVDLILDTILEKINPKSTKKNISTKDIKYFDNLFMKAKNILNNKTKDGDTLLHNMVFFGCYDIVKLLIKHNAIINLEDSDKQLPLHRSIFLSNIKVFNLLINNMNNLKEQINHKDKDGNTPLHLAILIKNYLIIKNLLINGADPYIMNNADLVAIDLATDKNKNFDEKIIQIFKKHLIT
jgi:ankyrin repeat protein